LREQLAELVSARRQLTEDKVSLSNQLDQLRDAMVRRLVCSESAIVLAPRTGGDRLPSVAAAESPSSLRCRYRE
jgi:transposase